MTSDRGGHDGHDHSCLAIAGWNEEVDDDVCQEHGRTAQELGHHIQRLSQTHDNGVNDAGGVQDQGNRRAEADDQRRTGSAAASLDEGFTDLGRLDTVDQAAEDADPQEEDRGLLEGPALLQAAPHQDAETGHKDGKNQEMLPDDLDLRFRGVKVHDALDLVEVALGGVLLDAAGIAADVDRREDVEDHGHNQTDGDAGVEIKTGNLLGHSRGGVQGADAEAHANAQQDDVDADDGVIAQGHGQHHADWAEGDELVGTLGQADQGEDQGDGRDEQDLLTALGAGPGELIAEGVEHTGGQDDLQRTGDDDDREDQGGIFFNRLNDHRGDLQNRNGV